MKHYFDMIIPFANNVQHIVAIIQALGNNGCLYLNNSAFRNRKPVQLKMKYAEPINLISKPNVIDFFAWLLDVFSVGLVESTF